MTRKWARPASAPQRGVPIGRGLRAHYAHTTHPRDRERTHEAMALRPHATQAGPEVWCTCPTTPPLTRIRDITFRTAT